MKIITLEHCGWHISGMAFVNLPGGKWDFVEMNPSFIPLGKLTKNNIVRCINDGNSGWESIDGADVNVKEVYQHSKHSGSYLIPRATLEIKNPNPELVCRRIA